MTKAKTGKLVADAGDFINCKEAAALLRLSEIHIRRMLTQKKLKRYKVGARTLILKSEALALIRPAE
jgi:excisionase family DNA binding protein